MIQRFFKYALFMNQFIEQQDFISTTNRLFYFNH